MTTPRPKRRTHRRNSARRALFVLLTTLTLTAPISTTALASAAPRVVTIPLPASPTGMAVGLGSAWYTTVDGTVARIDVRTNTVTATIRVGEFPVRTAIGAGGVWVSNCGSNAVSRVDPSRNVVVATIHVGVCPFGIATLDGAVWVVNADDKVMRIDPNQNAVVATIPAKLEACSTPSCYTFRGLTVGSHRVWVSTVRSNVLRIDPSTNRVDKVIHLLPCCVEVGELAVGFESLWATIPGGGLSNMVYRVDPRSGKVTHKIIADMADPFGVATLNDRVWVAFGNGGDSVIAAIDPRSNHITAKVPIGDFDAALATGAGSVWGARFNTKTAVRITP